MIMQLSTLVPVSKDAVDIKDGAVVTLNPEHISVVYPFSQERGFVVECPELRTFLMSLNLGVCFQYHDGLDPKHLAGFAKHTPKAKSEDKPEPKPTKTIGEAFAGNASKG